MNIEEIELWKESVFEHTHTLDLLANDRIAIKDLMRDHLKQYFKFDRIEFHDNFNRILLKFDYMNNPVIEPEDLVDLGMEFIITHDYSEELGHGVVIEVYPFGLPEVGGVIEE